MGRLTKELDEVLRSTKLRHAAEVLTKEAVEYMEDSLEPKVDHEELGHIVLTAIHRHLTRLAK